MSNSDFVIKVNNISTLYFGIISFMIISLLVILYYFFSVDNENILKKIIYFLIVIFLLFLIVFETIKKYDDKENKQFLKNIIKFIFDF